MFLLFIKSPDREKLGFLRLGLSAKHCNLLTFIFLMHECKFQLLKAMEVVSIAGTIDSRDAPKWKVCFSSKIVGSEHIVVHNGESKHSPVRAALVKAHWAVRINIKLQVYLFALKPIYFQHLGQRTWLSIVNTYFKYIVSHFLCSPLGSLEL